MKMVTTWKDFPIEAVKVRLIALNKFKLAEIDGVHQHVLVECCEALSLLLSLIFCQSYNTGQIPHPWNQAKISPIFKKIDQTIAENYRPIFLTSVPCKIIEKMVREEFLKYLCNNNLFSTCQHGFVNSRSCATNLLEAFDSIAYSLAYNFEVIILLLEFLKAFDKVVHVLLLDKMRSFGFDEDIINWTKVFLSNKTQRG